MKRLLFALHLAALGATSALLFGLLVFYAWGAYELSGETGFSAGIGMLGFLVMGVVVANLLLFSVVALRMSLRRHKYWRYAAPIPSALLFSLVGAWFLSGDPGDEEKLKVILLLEGPCLLLSGAAALFGKSAS